MKGKLRIGVDVSMLVKFTGGVGFYVFHLLDELIQQRTDCLFFLYAPSSKGDLEENLKHFSKYAHVRIRATRFLASRGTLWRVLTIPFFLRKDKIDVFWETIYIFHFLKPKRVKTLLTIYDFVPCLFRETMSHANALYHLCTMRGSLRNADYRLPISQGTAKRLKELFSLDYHSIIYPPQKPDVYYREMPLLAPFLAKHNLEYNHYLVTVGTMEPRKNFSLLVKLYFDALEKYGPENVMPLVIISSGGWKNEELQRIFSHAQEKYPSHFKVTGYVDDNELSLYLSGAKFYIALSMYEGYGMPIAEARRCRTPVICLDVPEMREAAEDDGIFLKCYELEEKLLPLMRFSKNLSTEEKPPLKLNYCTNAESIGKMALILDEIISAK